MVKLKLDNSARNLRLKIFSGFVSSTDIMISSQAKKWILAFVAGNISAWIFFAVGDFYFRSGATVLRHLTKSTLARKDC